MKPAEFLQRNKFLIGVAVLVLAGVAACAGLFLPQNRANAQMVAGLETKAQSLSEYAGKTIASKPDVEEARKLKDTCQACLDDLLAQLAKQAQPLAEPLREPDSAANSGQLEGSIWKLVYGKEVQDLLNKLESDFLVVAANPIVAQSYGDEIPPPDEVAKQTRYLLVQKYAIDAIAGLNSPGNNLTVPVFNGFSFLAAPERLLNPLHGQDFTPIPFEIRLSTDFANIPRVLHALLKSPVQFEITSISVARPERFERAGEVNLAWSTRAKMATPAVKRLAAATQAPGTTPATGAATPTPETTTGYMGPSQEVINAMVAEQVAMAKAMGEAMAEASRRQMEELYGPGGPGGIGTTNTTGTTTPTATVRRPTGQLKKDATTVTEDIKARLPKTLVDLTIKGYVADYKKKAS